MYTGGSYCGAQGLKHYMNRLEHYMEFAPCSAQHHMKRSSSVVIGLFHVKTTQKDPQVFSFHSRFFFVIFSQRWSKPFMEVTGEFFVK